MSRLPGPDEQWVESSEGDLDPDLAEEWDWPDDDWDEPIVRPWWPALQRLVILMLIAALVVPTVLVALR